LKAGADIHVNNDAFCCIIDNGHTKVVQVLREAGVSFPRHFSKITG